MSELLAAALDLADAAIAAIADIHVDEKRGEYYYDEINVKRWLADGGACELCEDNADMDWIPDDYVFESVFGDCDGPPGHPHCGCGLEYSVKRKRVYV